MSESLVKIMSLKSKKIIVTSFASNVARMETVFIVQRRLEEMSLVGRSMNRIFKAARQCGYLQNIKDPIDPRDAKNSKRKNYILMYR